MFDFVRRAEWQRALSTAGSDLDSLTEKASSLSDTIRHVQLALADIADDHDELDDLYQTDDLATAAREIDEFVAIATQVVESDLAHAVDALVRLKDHAYNARPVADYSGDDGGW